jgi:alpha-amylase/alpha-mannosidase (GH57 family)
VPSPLYLVVHGHFYQPPRENPWSGVVPGQPSAAPFPNWNARIDRECYAPNALARILDQNGLIGKIVNNYKYMSFNVGPTLLSWLKEHDGATHALIVAADREAARERGGHGPAIAQVFNHIIMPLANARDKLTQIKWGKRFFEATFGRSPEGMWLAETAVDLESLALMKKEGIRFTILAQNQIRATRPLDSSRRMEWTEALSPVDPREPYRVFFGPGEDDFLDVFVYDGPVSRSVAFENLLRDGKAFLDRIRLAFGTPVEGRPTLVNLATDGESYGHHFHFGEMALAWLFDSLLSSDDPQEIKLANYAEFLSLHPPRLEAQIFPNSSWSCAHGVERWRSDCGCRVGGDPSWNQKWRAPLREGLDALRDELIEIFEREGPQCLRDPWAARDDYVEALIHDYDPAAVDAFLGRHLREGSGGEESASRALALLESQLMSLYMFTSCGWFFDDLAGLEPIQNLRYAGRAIDLAQKFTPKDLTGPLLERLREAKPNSPLYANGEELWRAEVAGFSLGAVQAASQWAAAASMDTPEALKEYRYVSFKERHGEKVGKKAGEPLPHLFWGQASFRETRTREERDFAALVLADDGPKLNILVFDASEGEPPAFQRAKTIFLEKGPTFLRSALEAIYPEATAFSLESLWPSVKSEILTGQLREFFEELRDYATKAFRNYQDALRQYSLKENAWDWMDQFVFRVMAEVELDNILKPMRDGRPIDLKRLRDLIGQDSGGLSRNVPVIKERAGVYVKKLFSQLKRGPRRPTLLEELLNFLVLLKSVLKDLDFWENQNQYFRLLSHEPSLFRALGESDREFLGEIGRVLGFSDAFTSARLA